MWRDCGLRTLCDLSEDSKLESVGEVNKRMEQSRDKMIQHLRLHLLIREVRPEVVRRRENETLERLSWGMALQVICEEREVGVVVPVCRESRSRVRQHPRDIICTSHRLNVLRSSPR